MTLHAAACDLCTPVAALWLHSNKCTSMLTNAASAAESGGVAESAPGAPDHERQVDYGNYDGKAPAPAPFEERGDYDYDYRYYADAPVWRGDYNHVFYDEGAREEGVYYESAAPPPGLCMHVLMRAVTTPNLHHLRPLPVLMHACTPAANAFTQRQPTRLLCRSMLVAMRTWMHVLHACAPHLYLQRWGLLREALPLLIWVTSSACM